MPDEKIAEAEEVEQAEKRLVEVPEEDFQPPDLFEQQQVAVAAASNQTFTFSSAPDEWVIWGPEGWDGVLAVASGTSVGADAAIAVAGAPLVLPGDGQSQITLENRGSADITLFVTATRGLMFNAPQAAARQYGWDLTNAIWRRKLVSSTGRALMDLLNVSAFGDGSGVALLGFDFQGVSKIAAVAGMLYNGATWDRPRNNEELTLLASAQRTADTFSADQVNYNARGVAIIVDVTSINAGTPSVTPKIQAKDPISAQYVAVWNGSALTTVGLHRFLIYPGATGGAWTATPASMALPRGWRLWADHADAQPIDYSIAGVQML